MNFEIKSIESPKQIDRILEGINTYNLRMIPSKLDAWTPLEYQIESPEKQIIASILEGIGYWNGLEIKVLWVDENYRNQGLGTALLQHTEQVVKAKGATISMLDTFDFQAKGFYLKNDYVITGIILNFPVGHERIYLHEYLK